MKYLRENISSKTLNQMNMGDVIMLTGDGSLQEVHRVPNGWLYVFRASGINSIHTQFVPEKSESTFQRAGFCV